MAARKTESFPIMILGLSQIVVDHALQSRVSTSVEYQREFSEAMLRGDEFPPVTVFFDGAKYWLADGFHRYGARKILARSERRFEGIKAEVRNGTKLDAVVFSAGCNQKFSIPRTPKDIEKSLGMLFSIEGWLSKTANVIAKHVGINGKTVSKYRVAYCDANELELPDEFTDDNGNLYSARVRRNPKPCLVKKRGRNVGSFQARVANTTVYLCSENQGSDAANSILQDKKSAMLGSDGLASEDSVACPRDNDALRRYLAARGIHCEAIPKESLGYIPGLHAVKCGGFIATYANVVEPDCCFAAIARILCVKHMVSSNWPGMILCFGESPTSRLQSVAQELGIRFVTTQQFIASIESDSESSPAEAT